uniref:Tocopherol cyclase n=1 Tax=Tetraselmis sp. GSL018 TaxID=582737 RepID=A0A061SAE0_9CHLO
MAKTSVQSSRFKYVFAYSSHEPNVLPSIKRNTCRLPTSNTKVARKKVFEQSLFRRVDCGATTERSLSSIPALDKFRTPHSGYHFDGRTDRFFEGWYFKVHIPELQESFALIYSIEDPLGNSRLSATGAQVMGPGDGYLLHYSKSVSCFWASASEMELGACFVPRQGESAPGRLVDTEEFDRRVELGFQAGPTLHQGCIEAQDGGAPGDLRSSVSRARWSFTVEPRCGWGDTGGEQVATAGWLAALPVFEPHWQILMAHGEATGWLEWGDERYEFESAPAYSEKNWGGGFPKRWFWVQCNSFDGQPGLSLTSGGGRRGILIAPSMEEDVGMICVHHEGKFIEMMPQKGEVVWNIDPWGSWRVWAVSDKHEVLVEASTQADGTPLRAPTGTEGLAPFCRDTFGGECRLRVWERNGFGMRHPVPFIDATSSTAALEVRLLLSP